LVNSNTELFHEHYMDITTGGGGLCQGKPAVDVWGVVASVVLSGGESPPQGEGLDGSTQPAQDTQPGHVGPAQHAPTSLGARANRGES
jgi:hypothetical protein